MISTGDLRKGNTIVVDNELVKVLDFQHVKMGRGSAFVRVQMRNLRTGATTERTFQAGSRFEQARLERRTVQYLYQDGDNYVFMDTETYEQPTLSAQLLGDAVRYLKEGMNIDLLLYGDEPIDVEIPTSVELRVERSDPGLRGDTAAGASKPATLETGMTVQVPLFVNEGDVIRVDTRTGAYIERVG
ncbi:MAG: elongation factor P [Chloroflexota bacterium]|nr:elongation factor P [Chloroflexota bacterium]